MSTGWRTLRRGDERDFTILRIREVQQNRLHSFLALDCRRKGEPRLDPGEDIRVELVPSASLRERVASGEITHALVLATMCQAAVQGLFP